VVYFYTMRNQQPPSRPPAPPPSSGPPPTQWGFEQNRAVAERQHDQNIEIAKRVDEATINAGNLALRMVLLINGGAAVALLSFMGNLKDQRQAIAGALAWFAWGVVAAALALGLAYATNFCAVGIYRSMIYWYEHPYVRVGPQTAKWRWWTLGFHIGAVAWGLAALVWWECCASKAPSSTCSALPHDLS
jgi:hypothetical protein